MGGDSFRRRRSRNGVVYVGSSDGNFEAFDAAGTAELFGHPEDLHAAVDGDDGELRRLVAGGRRRHRLRRFRRRQAVRVRTVVERVPRRGRSRRRQPRPSTGSARATSRASRSCHRSDWRSTSCSRRRRSRTASCTPGPNDASCTRSTRPSAVARTLCEPEWVAQSLPTPTLSSPAVANGVVYVGSDDLYAFDAAGSAAFCHSRRRLGSRMRPAVDEARPAATCDSSPAIANGTVYVGADDHKLYAFDASGTHRLLGYARALCSTVDRRHRRCDPLVAGVVERTSSTSDPTTASCTRSARRARPAARAHRRRARRCGPQRREDRSSRHRRSPVTSSTSGPNDNQLYAFSATGAHRLHRCAEGLRAVWTALTRRRRVLVAGGRQRCRVRRLGRSQALRVQRGRDDRLQRQPEVVCAVVDGDDRGHGPVVAGRRERRRLRRFGRHHLYAFDANGGSRAAAYRRRAHHCSTRTRARPCSRRRPSRTGWSTSVPSEPAPSASPCRSAQPALAGSAAARQADAR